MYLGARPGCMLFRGPVEVVARSASRTFVAASITSDTSPRQVEHALILAEVTGLVGLGENANYRLGQAERVR